MLKKILFVLALVAVPTAAFAQDDTGGGGGGGGSAAGGGEGTGGATTAPAASSGGEGPAIFQHGTMGLSFPAVGGFDFSALSAIIASAGGGTATAAPVPTVSFLMFQDNKTALDILIGVALTKTPDTTMGTPPVTVPGATKFGFAAGLGYRIYQHHSERIHTFVEPFAKISVNDVSSFADVLAITVGANMGAECMFTDWFSISGTIGVQANFANKFNNINVNTVTNGLAANFYWH
jgi:hypothetical protein